MPATLSTDTLALDPQALWVDLLAEPQAQPQARPTERLPRAPLGLGEAPEVADLAQATYLDESHRGRPSERQARGRALSAAGWGLHVHASTPSPQAQAQAAGRALAAGLNGRAQGWGLHVDARRAPKAHKARPRGLARLMGALRLAFVA